MNETTMNHRPNRSDERIVSMCWPRRRCHAETAMTMAAANIHALVIVWGKAARTTGLVSTATMSTSSARPPSAAIW